MQLINAEKRILVIGSLNANPADRAINRDNIRSLQIIDDTEKTGVNDNVYTRCKEANLDHHASDIFISVTANPVQICRN